MCNCLDQCETCECELHTLENRYPRGTLIKIGNTVLTWKRWLDRAWDAAVAEAIKCYPQDAPNVRGGYMSQLKRILNLAASSDGRTNLDVAIHKGRTLQNVMR